MAETISTNTSINRWTGAWLDAAAFALGLWLAWDFQWGATDLVWSLWLSSLIVGYSMIVWKISASFRELAGNMTTDRSGTGSAGAKTAALVAMGIGSLFMLAFFTVHFGGFHFGHSVFLQSFFPITDKPVDGLVDWSIYGEVFSRYWWFLPAAFIAERHGFESGVLTTNTKSDSMMAPYKNVIRMHLLIFFFAFASFTHLLNSFAIYAVVYAVYFFPWRLVRREKAPS